MLLVVIIHFVIILLQNFRIIGGILDGNYLPTIGGRLFSTFNGPYEFSSYMTLLLPLYYINIIKNKNNKKQIIKSILFIIFIAIGVYMSQSRTSLIIVFSLLLLIPILEKRHIIINFIKTNKIKSLVLFFAVATIIVTICGLLLKVERFKTLDISSMFKTLKLSWENKSFERYKEEGFYVINEDNTDFSFAIRINKWMALIDGTIKHPIFGLGLSVSKEACDGNYIRILAETGIVGILAWIGIVANILKNTKKKQGGINVLANYGMLVLLMTAVFIDIFEASKIMMLYWFILGCAYASNNNCKTEVEKIKKSTSGKEKNMNKNATVAILMATYNGEKYIKEQIESILNQTYQNFVLYIRDDNSKDDTNKIIDEYEEKYSNRVVKVKDDRIAKGACNNF